MTVNERPNDRTVIDAYPLAPGPVPVGPVPVAPVPVGPAHLNPAYPAPAAVPETVHGAGGSGVPPEWRPPTAGETQQGSGGGKHRAKIAVAGALVAAVVATAAITAGVVKSGDDGASSTATGPGSDGQGSDGQGSGGQGSGGQGSSGQGTGTTGQGFTGGGRGGQAMASALHGTYVVSDGNGGYVTQETQTGTVSAVGSDSITVKSADGYHKRYAVGTATSIDSGQNQISDVVSGHTVRVIATTSGDTSTAATITDSNLAATQQGGFGPGGQQQGGQEQGGTTTGT
jgi:hypothetical protein